MLNTFKSVCVLCSNRFQIPRRPTDQFRALCVRTLFQAPVSYYIYILVYIFCLTNYYAKPPKSGAKKGCEFSKETRRSRNSSGGGERTILQKTEDTSLRLMEVIHFRTNCFSSGVKSKSKFRLTAMFIYIILLRCQNIHRLIYPLTFDFRCSLVCFLFPFFCFFLL